MTLPFEPEEDGVTFHLAGAFLATVEGGAKNLARWTGLPVGVAAGPRPGGGPVVHLPDHGAGVRRSVRTRLPSRWTGVASTKDKRNSDIWLLASHPGDGEYKSAVQQAVMHVPRNTGGAVQHLTFPEIPDQPAGVSSIPLAATSDAGANVCYYVREGPAEVDGDKLRLTPVPPGARFPVKVTVVAWQWGHAAEPKLDTAEPVERTFFVRQ